jgi:cell division protein FtsW
VTVAHTPQPFSLQRALAGLDRGIMLNTLALVLLGLVVSMAASPAAAGRMNIDASFHFATRHTVFVAVGAAVLAAAAMLPVLWVRRTGVILFAASLPLMAIAAAMQEVKGAARWIDFGPVSLQPSELLKPAIVVVWAWMLSERHKNPTFPGMAVSVGLFALSAGLLLLQPDVGQTALLGMTLALMLFLAGAPWRYVAGGAVAAVVFAVGAYATFGHVRQRVNDWLNPTGEAAYQVGKSLEAIQSGGLFGRGPGEGQVKLELPDAHADFLFAVAAEEFGLLASLIIIGLFAALVVRGLSRASRLIDPFAQLAAAGLTLMLAVQATIHMGVNMSLIPAKGMTLPLVSYGGSSMVSAALTIGFILALTRARPGAYLYPPGEKSHD